MCEDHDRAVRVANEFIGTHKEFTYNEIVEELREKAHTTWLGPYYHVSDFLNRLTNHWGILKKRGNLYIRVDK